MLRPPLQELGFLSECRQASSRSESFRGLRSPWGVKQICRVWARRWILLRHVRHCTVPSGYLWLIQLRWGWILWYRLGRGFVCTPFPDRSPHRSSKESALGWGPSIVKTLFWPGRIGLWTDFSPRWLSLGDSRQEGSPLTGSGHDLSPLVGAVEAVGVAPEGAQLIGSGLSTEVAETILQSRAPSMRKLYSLKLRLRVWRPLAWSSYLPVWYSAGVLAGPFLRRVSPLHPEGLRGGYSGLPRPSWWPFSGQNPLVTCFLWRGKLVDLDAIL